MTLKLITTISEISDDDGYAVCSGEDRVDVYPPYDYDAFPKDGFVSLHNANGMTASEARRMAALLLTAADYLEALQEKSARLALAPAAEQQEREA